MPNWFRAGLATLLASVVGICVADGVYRSSQTPKVIQGARVVRIDGSCGDDMHLSNATEVRVAQLGEPIIYSSEIENLKPGDSVTLAYRHGIFGNNVGVSITRD